MSQRDNPNNPYNKTKKQSAFDTGPSKAAETPRSSQRLPSRRSKGEPDTSRQETNLSTSEVTFTPQSRVIVTRGSRGKGASSDLIVEEDMGVEYMMISNLQSGQRCLVEQTNIILMTITMYNRGLSYCINETT